MKEIQLGTAAGLTLSASLSAALASLLAWALLWGSAFWLLGLDAGGSAFFALLALALHWSSVLAHHLGHAWAAQQVGYPMHGVRFWAVMGTDLYPADEPDLPAAIHVRRALAGPVVSILLTLIAAAVTVAARPLGGLLWWLIAWCSLDNLLLTIGGLLPLGFTDGDTLIRWWGKR